MQTINDRATWLKGGTARCSIIPRQPIHPHRLILMGAPGVGKGTQAELLAAYLGTCHLSTGDVFRTAKNIAESERSPAMGAALDCMRRGELISDETVLALVADRAPCLCCGGGFLLDGFPRTVAQAKALEKILKEQRVQLDAVIDYALSLKKIIARLSGRRVCPDCKAVYHVETRKPKMEGVCDHCSGKLYQRDDDRRESIRVRMAAYAKNATPLKRFYRRRGLLMSVPAAGTPREIFERTLEAIKNRLPGPPEPERVCA